MVTRLEVALTCADRIDRDIDIDEYEGVAMTAQLLVRLPDELARRLRLRVAPRKRSAFVQRLLEDALPASDPDADPLYLAALAVEQDDALATEMAEWDATLGDGLSLARGTRPR